MIGDVVHYFGGDPDDPSYPDHCCPALVHADSGGGVLDLTVNYRRWFWCSADSVPQGGQSEPATWHAKH